MHGAAERTNWVALFERRRQRRYVTSRERAGPVSAATREGGWEGAVTGTISRALRDRASCSIQSFSFC
jgi:hypothetical protein